MKQMSEAPHTGEAILAKVGLAGMWTYRIVRFQKSMERAGCHWAKSYHWESEDGDRLRGCDISGWYDISELIQSAADRNATLKLNEYLAGQLFDAVMELRDLWAKVDCYEKALREIAGTVTSIIGPPAREKMREIAKEALDDQH